MNKKTIKIGKWNVSKDLFDEYVKFSIHADNYLMNKGNEEDFMSEYERNLRWHMCVKRVMEIHREICKILKIEYTSDSTNEFYSAFHKEVRKHTNRNIREADKVE